MSTETCPSSSFVGTEAQCCVSQQRAGDVPRARQSLGKQRQARALQVPGWKYGGFCFCCGSVEETSPGDRIQMCWAACRHRMQGASLWVRHATSGLGKMSRIGSERKKCAKFSVKNRHLNLLLGSNDLAKCSFKF